jgi:hypothetical protein
MAISLYDVSVGTYLQVTKALAGVLDRGLKHCQESNADPTDVVQTRLYPDMLPFAFQIASVAHHGAGSIEALKSGKATPPTATLPSDYAGCQAMLADAIARLEALKPADVEALAGRDVTFAVGDVKMPFTAEGFILSFSLPNFYFHATTAYDILRSKGTPLGKRHFMGQLKTKAA